MDQPQQPTTDLAVIENLQVVVNDIKKLFPVMQSKATAAKMLLEGLTVIANDEQDDKAKTIIINAREVHDVIQAKRMTLTAPLDRLKEILMGPEKMITTDAKQLNSPYTLARQLRDRFATQKEAKAAAERLRIANELAKSNEITRIEGEIEKNVATGVLSAVQASEKAIAAYWETITLANYDEAFKRMNSNPTMKKETYDAWFYTQYNQEIVKDTDFGTLVIAKKDMHPYESLAGQFADTIIPTMVSYRERLPEKKAQLDAAKKAADDAVQAAADAKKAADDVAVATNEKQRKAAQAQLDAAKKAADDAVQAAANAAKKAADEKAIADKEAADRSATLAAQQTEVTETAQQSIAQGQLQNQFKSQIETQQIDTADGVKRSRQATIVCAEEEMIQVLSELLFMCLSHKDFPGIIQKDKKGNLKHDESMRPMYVPWLESMLTFAAANCPEIDTTEGIVLKDVVKTIQKA